jgi:hypothetical protein
LDVFGAGLEAVERFATHAPAYGKNPILSQLFERLPDAPDIAAASLNNHRRSCLQMGAFMENEQDIQLGPRIDGPLKQKLDTCVSH